MIKKIEKAVKYIKNKSSLKPELGVILGTGLSNTAALVEDQTVISYQDIPGFLVSTAPSHAGKLIVGNMAGKAIVIMQGRLHYYEGYSLKEITFPVRVMAALGINTLMVTNAAGSLNPALVPGDLVLIKDHLNLMGTNPLIGHNYSELGERFPSLHNTYDIALRQQIQKISEQHGLTQKEGVYAAVTGPSFETRAECLMLRNLGADLVGMSTVPEVIVARHQGLRVVGISVVTNLSNIFHSKPHSQAEIRAHGAASEKHLQTIIKAINIKKSRG